MYLQQSSFQVRFRSRKIHKNADTLAWHPATEPIISVIQQQLGQDLNALQPAQLADQELAPYCLDFTEYPT